MYISCAGLRAKDIDILVVNCSLFNPTPSLSAMIVNHFKMRSNVLSYNLAGVFYNCTPLHYVCRGSPCIDNKEEQHHAAHAHRLCNLNQHGFVLSQTSSALVWLRVVPSTYEGVVLCLNTKTALVCVRA